MDENLYLENRDIRPLRPKDGVDTFLWVLKFITWLIIGFVLFGVFYVLLFSAIAGPEEFAFTIVRLAIFVMVIVFALVLLNIGHRINTDISKETRRTNMKKLRRH